MPTSHIYLLILVLANFIVMLLIFWVLQKIWGVLRQASKIEIIIGAPGPAPGKAAK